MVHCSRRFNVDIILYAISYDHAIIRLQAPRCGGEGLLKMLDEVKPVTMVQIEAARARLEGLSIVSPLVPCDAAPAGKTVRLKLENLQPIGSFKIRPIGNAVLARAPADLTSGIYTTTPGNSALTLPSMPPPPRIPPTALAPLNPP